MPRTLAQNAQYIANTIKPAIKSAIEAQGVTVPSTDSFLDYADRIGEIEGGGSGYQLKDLPTGAISTVNDAAELPLNALKVSVEAAQDLHGYDHPWVGGADRNKMPLTVNQIKTASSEGTWSGNIYSYNGISWELLIDNGGNIAGIKVSGTATDRSVLRVSSRLRNDFTLSPDYYMIRFNTSSTISGLVATINYTLDGAAVRLAQTTGGNNRFRYTADMGYLGCFFEVPNGTECNNEVFYPIIKLSSDTDNTFTPYSNICPISGWSSATITDKDDLTTPTTTETWTHNFTDTQGNPLTVYGGEWDVVSGELKQTDGYIASYNGETLPSTWISDRDEYASGTTPTIGAEVVYKLATPTAIDLSPLSIRMLEGTNNVFADCGDVIEGEYFIGSSGAYDLYDYIQTDGTQLIDTGRAITAGDVVNTIFTAISGGSNGAYVWGKYVDPYFTALIIYPSNGFYRHYDHATVNDNPVDQTNFTVGKITEDSYTIATTLGGNYTLFDTASVKLYAFSINGDDYLPCKRRSDGKFGLYDVANSQFLTDSASGNAITGGNNLGVRIG